MEVSPRAFARPGAMVARQPIGEFCRRLQRDRLPSADRCHVDLRPPAARRHAARRRRRLPSRGGRDTKGGPAVELPVPDLSILTAKEDLAMSIQTRYLFSAAMDVEPEKEALFNEVYDKEHVPLILSVPGVVSAARFKRQPVTMILGGERRTIVVENEPRYNALYELDSPEVLLSPAWAKVVDQGRWPGEVRPYTKNRRHVMFERIL